MIQFNLLPDIKIQYIKARKAKRTIVAVSILAVGISVTLMVIMVSAMLFQKHHISDLNKDIKSYESSLNNTQDLAKILTIQNQLSTLPSLYTQRPVTSRLFPYIEATTPTQIIYNKISVDFVQHSITVNGTADTLESVNRYVDTLKFTTYTVGDSTQGTSAFTDVVLGSFGRDTKQASFSVTMSFNPDIFDSTKSVKLNVPKTITTRSETELPGSVFDTKGSN